MFSGMTNHSIDAKGRIVDGTGENREKEREENSVPFRSQEKLYNEYKNTL